MQMPTPGPDSRSILERIFYNRSGIRSGWRLLAWILLSMAGFIAVVIGLGLMVFAMGMQRTLGSTTPAVVLFSMEWIVFVPIFAAALVVAIVMERRPIGSMGLGFHSRWLAEFGRGAAWGVGLMSLIMLILVCTGSYRIHGFHESFAPALGWGLMMAVGFLGVGLFEEFLFRGYMLQNMIDGLGLRTATVISCLLFAAVHIPNSGENLLGILDVLLSGVLLIVLIIRTRSLWMAVGLHAAWDWSQNYLFGVADSGAVLPGGLLSTTAHGPAWLSGGTAGPEGSVVALVVEGMAILVFAHARWITSSSDAARLWARYVWPKVEPVTPEVAPLVPPMPEAGT